MTACKRAFRPAGVVFFYYEDREYREYREYCGFITVCIAFIVFIVFPLPENHRLAARREAISLPVMDSEGSLRILTQSFSVERVIKAAFWMREVIILSS